MAKRNSAQKGPKQPTQDELNQGLKQAAESGDLASFKDFLDQGASLDASEAECNMLAIVGEQPAILDLLTDPSNGLYKQFNDGTTELHLAAIRNDVDAIEKIFTEHPERMLELTTRGESVLNWANYFMRHKVISYLLAHEEFEDKLEQQQTEDAYYDLARGHQILAEFFKTIDKLYYVPIYYDIANQFYKLMKNGSDKYVSEIEKSLADFNERHPIVSPAANRGFESIDVPGDGNCFFHAVADQLVMMNAEVRLNAPELRERAVAYMVEHPKAFRGFCVGDLDQYISEMVVSGTYADNPIILALSRALNVSFYVLNSDESKPVIIRQKNAAHCLYLGYTVNNHYASLSPMDDELVAQVNKEIAAAEFDCVEEAMMAAESDVELSEYSSLAAEAPDDLSASRDELWNSDWEDDCDEISFQLERQDAVADLRQWDATVQPADTVEVISQPQPISGQENASFLDHILLELGGAIDMVEEHLVGLEELAKKAAADWVQGFDGAGVNYELAELQRAAKDLTTDALSHLEGLTFAATSLASQISIAQCTRPAIQEFEMETWREELADLAAATPSPAFDSSPFTSRSSSTGSLGLTGLFASSSGRSSPAALCESPIPLTMRK